MLIGESNVAIDPAIGGYGVADIYLGEFSPQSKKKSPQKSGESEYPAMDQEEYNRLLQNAIEQIKAEAEQKFEERESM